MKRAELLCELARRIIALQVPHPVRVGIDGVDCSGKTGLADELNAAIQQHGRPVLRASSDGFHNPRAIRYRRGVDSPEGYYLDSFNYALIRQTLLDPLQSGGSRRVRTAAFDVRRDTPIQGDEVLVAPETVLLFDGIFLARPELSSCWDLRIFLDVNFETVLERAARRDLVLFGTPEAVLAQYRRRYIPGQQLYFAACRPRESADVLIDHNDFQNPMIVPEHPSSQD